MYKKMHPRVSPRNFIAVDGIDSVITAFKKAGGKELVEKMAVPNIGFTFIGADPEGNVIGLHEPHRGAARTRPAPKKRAKQR
jgi:predicted enzyme related to lactoylglutathione lyase